MANFTININEQNIIGSNIVGENVLKGDLLYLATNGKYYKSSAITKDKSTTELRLAEEDGLANSTVSMLSYGYFEYDQPILVSGIKYYVSTVPGQVTTTLYTTNNNVARYVGTALDESTFLFNPDQTYVSDNGYRVNDVPLKAALISHTHLESDISDLDKYSQLEVNNLLLDKEDNDNKVTDFTIIDDITYPTTKAVEDRLIDQASTKMQVDTGFLLGMALSINPDNTKFDIASGLYNITDYSDLYNISSNIIDFQGLQGITPQFLFTHNVTYVGIDKDQNLVQRSSPFTNEDRRIICSLGTVIHSNNSTINLVEEIKYPLVSATNQLHSFIKTIGSLNLRGNIFSANGSNLQIDKSEGDIWGLGINAQQYDNPHMLTLPVQTGLTFRYRLQNGTEYSNTTLVNPNQYDNGGILSNVSNNKFTIQHISIFQEGDVRIQYGQNIYDTYNDALLEVGSESFVVEQNIAENAIFRAYLVIKKGVTNIATAVSNGDAGFVSVGKFGNVTSSAGSIVTSSEVISALGYTPENEANKVFDFNVLSNDLYPSILAVQNALNTKENAINKVTTFNDIDNTKFPTVEAVFNYIEGQKGSEIATLIGGKLDVNQLPELAITSVIVASELDINSFVIANGGYDFQQGDVIILDSGNGTFFMYNGGDKSLIASYNEVNSTEIDWSQVLNTPTTIGGYNISDAYTKTEVDGLVGNYVTLDTDQTITSRKTINRGGSDDNGISLQETGSSLNSQPLLNISNTGDNSRTPLIKIFHNSNETDGISINSSSDNNLFSISSTKGRSVFLSQKEDAREAFYIINESQYPSFYIKNNHVNSKGINIISSEVNTGNQISIAKETSNSTETRFSVDSNGNTTTQKLTIKDVLEDNTANKIAVIDINDEVKYVEKDSFVSKSGNATLNGDLTVDNIIGNGSQLTNVDASTLRGRSDYLKDENLINADASISSTNYESISFFQNTSGSTNFPKQFGGSVLFNMGSSYQRTFSIWKDFDDARWYLFDYNSNRTLKSSNEIYHSGNFDPSSKLDVDGNGSQLTNVNASTINSKDVTWIDNNVKQWVAIYNSLNNESTWYKVATFSNSAVQGSRALISYSGGFGFSSGSNKISDGGAIYITRSNASSGKLFDLKIISSLNNGNEQVIKESKLTNNGNGTSSVYARVSKYSGLSCFFQGDNSILSQTHSDIIEEPVSGYDLTLLTNYHSDNFDPSSNDPRQFGIGSNAIESSNFDTLNENGIYSSIFNGTTGSPSNAGGVVVTHKQTSSNFAFQKAVRNTTGEMWDRFKANGTWGPWSLTINIKTINTSTLQTSSTLNSAFPYEGNENGTIVVNRDAVQSFMYIRVNSTQWKAVSLGSTI